MVEVSRALRFPEKIMKVSTYTSFKDLEFDAACSH